MANFGVPKVGKTHMGMGATSSEVRLPDKVTLDGATPGEILIPAKPLSIALANFDREAGTVIGNLEPGIDIISEDFFEDEDGELLIPVMMGPADFQKLFARLEAFVKDAENEGTNLIIVDGGTIIWEEVREWKLPKEVPTNAGQHSGPQPSQYNTSNTTMRTGVMQRLYGARAHTLITREAGPIWISASETMKDANGKQMNRPDGWNKTGHYIDLDMELQLIESAMGTKRVAVPRMPVLTTAILGRVINAPTFSKMFELNYRRPLLLPEDAEEYTKALKEEGDLSYGEAPTND
jgi:hypothetical protein